MSNHGEKVRQTMRKNARFSAVFGSGLVGPAGLQKASLHGDGQVCLTFPATSRKALGDRPALSNLLGPARLPANEPRTTEHGGLNG